MRKGVQGSWILSEVRMALVFKEKERFVSGSRLGISGCSHTSAKISDNRTKLMTPTPFSGQGLYKVFQVYRLYNVFG